MQPVQQIFVYGTLRSGFHHFAYAHIRNNFNLVDTARVQGKVYDLGEYPAAVPTTEETFVVGELYRLKDGKIFDDAIQALDEYEGLHPANGETALYRRELATVYVNDQSFTAWIYWYNHSVEGKTLIASGDVVQYIEQNK